MISFDRARMVPPSEDLCFPPARQSLTFSGMISKECRSRSGSAVCVSASAAPAAGSSVASSPVGPAVPSSTSTAMRSTAACSRSPLLIWNTSVSGCARAAPTISSCQTAQAVSVTKSIADDANCPHPRCWCTEDITLRECSSISEQQAGVLAGKILSAASSEAGQIPRPTMLMRVHRRVSRSWHIEMTKRAKEDWSDDLSRPMAGDQLSDDT